ncbi:phosphoglycerate mutase family protein [Caldimonas brevitalea]|uniref:Phosphoglycerate mutase n=1 Tax=Caldimonas brevitalea TaxID=413882 RepID=A0A0G3BS43_9BURK|nr:phosphoglycerate mutase family protein [Caldimonas brevitalea]AKJ30231.1 hypothetical protein AAW51_3540 [Caldimonas brevitalea]
MSKIYLVRHGLVDYQSLGLSAQGRAFAERLPSLLPPDVDFLATDVEPRCQETIGPLARHLRLTPKTYAKETFAAGLPLMDAAEAKVAVICYRIESVNPLLLRLGFPPFTQADRDTSYEKILVHINENGRLTLQTLATGQRKPA